jgi:ElaB/YqjD/DUF883 family membrane-anchored ribosome-binding protein
MTIRNLDNLSLETLLEKVQENSEMNQLQKIRQDLTHCSSNLEKLKATAQDSKIQEIAKKAEALVDQARSLIFNA